MDAETFLSHLRGALPTSWSEVNDPPRKPRAYSAYIFAALARAAEAGGMDYRGHSYKRELLYSVRDDNLHHTAS
ncbi:hypothetical protein K2Z83_23880 [Oscillochloris sp. ZM17-4]|uniref:hypothetical protein n=1 Tax=Oscillochloris sp. ZM17-4 TaxID=2866714 RepID=UPI001C734A89|nr:hypothetical protein [Oscillochloris sp. ZM17-4]MBX0330701.1 hypothetical protein [Oscillochloris sp. ZM17-4]